jgi:hypothetical protein
VPTLRHGLTVYDFFFFSDFSFAQRAFSTKDKVAELLESWADSRSPVRYPRGRAEDR